MKLRVGDKVKVIAGKDRGKEGLIKAISKANNTVLVEGVNFVKKHIKPGTLNEQGGIVSFEKPINISNVMYLSEEHSRPVRLGFTFVKGKKMRRIKKLNDVLEK